MGRSLLGGGTREFAFSGYGSPPKNNSGRASSRAFAQSQKNEILYQQDNKCAVCHRKLDPRDIEYDHKKAWAAKGKTITKNGRAVCGSCHNKITHNQRLKKTEKKRKAKANTRRAGSLLDARMPKIHLPRGLF